MKRVIRLILVMGLIVAGYLSFGPLSSLFQSEWVIVLFLVSLVLIGLYLYSADIEASFRGFFRATVSPIIEESHRASLVLSNRFEATEKALEHFAGAIHLYARHLANHTSAIQGLSEASQALKGSAAEQNRILSQFTNAFVQQRSQEEISKIQRVIYDIERRTRERLQARDALEKEIPEIKRKPQVEASEEERPVLERKPQIEPQEEERPVLERKPQIEPQEEEIQSPLGCVVKPKALLARRHYSINS